MKVYRDGDDELPTICGTGLEDYVGSAWGMGAHNAPYGGAPLVRRATVGVPTATPSSSASIAGTCPTRSCSRRPAGHDPADRRGVLPAGHEAAVEAYERTNPLAGRGLDHDATVVARVGHLRARRRLLRDVIRVLPRAAGRAAARYRRRARRHRTPPVGDPSLDGGRLRRDRHPLAAWSFSSGSTPSGWAGRCARR